jgi:4-aminobutyrate aminotransferase
MGHDPRHVPGPKARAILARDAAVISPSYPRDDPFVMDRGRGSEVWDVDGHRYIDWAAGIAVCSTGHSHPDVVRAVQEQAARFLHISSDYYHEAWVALAERLDAIAPFKEDAACFMTNSGTESVEAAIKLARYHTGRGRFIGFFGGFHGRTMGALAFTASKAAQREGFFPSMEGVTQIPFPDPYRTVLEQKAHHADAGDAVIDYLENVVFRQAAPPGDVAAILVEPIQGEGGYVVAPAGFFPRLRELCDRHGILLIADEVQSGVGRTGRWWAIEHWGIEPDIVCSAKGIASGLPLGAMIARKSLMTWPPGSHGNTYGGNPVSCAAALETLRLIEGGLMVNASERGREILTALRRMQESHPSIGDVRGMGLMLGVELVKDRVTKDPAADLAERFVHSAFERGLLLLGCGQSVVRIAPPLNIDAALTAEALEIFEEALISAERASGAA